MNKKEFLASIQQESLHPAQIINEEMTAKVYGEAAVVTRVYREKGTSRETLSTAGQVYGHLDKTGRYVAMRRESIDAGRPLAIAGRQDAVREPQRTGAISSRSPT